MPQIGAERAQDAALDHVQAPKQQRDAAHQVEKNDRSHRMNAHAIVVAQLLATTAMIESSIGVADRMPYFDSRRRFFRTRRL